MLWPRQILLLAIKALAQVTSRKIRAQRTSVFGHKFLEYLVKETRSGRADWNKGYSTAVEVSDAHDPQSIVRAALSRNGIT